MLELLKEKCQKSPVASVAWGALILLLFATYYRVNSIPSLEAEYTRLLNEQQVVTYNVSNGRGLEKDLSAIHTLSDKVEKNFIDPGEKASNFHYFFSLEETTGVKINDPKMIGIEPFNAGKFKSPGYKSLAITHFKFNIEGSYSNILKLIYALQKGPLVSRIEGCTIDVGSHLEAAVLSATIEVGFLGSPN